MITQTENEKKSSVVLYDASTGRIFHIHHCVTVPGGGGHPGKTELEKAALQIVSARQRDSLPASVGYLHTEPDAIKGGAKYHVDLQSFTLIEEQR